MKAHTTFEIYPSANGDASHLTLRGNLLTQSLPQFVRAMDEAKKCGKTVNLDLRDLEIIDSKGLGALVECYRSLSEQDIEFRLLNVNGAVLRSLQLTNLTSLFNLTILSECPADQVRRQRQALWQSYEYIEQIMLALGEGVIGLGTGGEILFMNPSAEKLLGFSEDDLLGKQFISSVNFFQTGSIQDRNLHSPILDVARGSSRVHRAEIVLLWNDGSRVPCQLVATSIQHHGAAAGAIIGLTDLREREQVSQNLQETHRRYQDLVKSTSGMVYMVDLDGRITFASDGLLKALQYSFKELAHKKDTLLFDPEDRNGTREYLESRLQGRPAAPLPCEMHAKSGNIISVEISANPFFGREGDLEGLQVIVQDMSEQKRAEQSLKASEKRLRAIAENSPEAIIFYRLSDDRVDYANPACAELSEYSLEEFYASEPPQLAHPDELHAGLQCVERCIAGESIPFRESRVVTKSGKIKWVETAYVPLFDENNVQFGFMSITRDISKRKRTLEKLQESEDRYRRMLGAVSSYTFSVDPNRNGGNADHSEGSIAILGWTPEELNADPGITSRILHSEDRDMVLTHFRRIMSGEEVSPISFRIHHRDGGLRWLRMTAVSYLDENGTLLRYDGLVEDITNHRKMEEELRQAQKMESVGQLAGGIAHDFNNLLTGILGNLSLAEMDAPESTRQLLREAQKAGQRAADLVRKLLAFSRKSQISMRPMNLASLIREVADFAGETFDKRIQIDLRQPSCLQPVMGDPVQLHQVLLNLFVNARDSLEDAMRLQPNDKARILIETNNVTYDKKFCTQGTNPQPGTYVEIAVTDTGIGMAPETKKRIFDPFYTTKEGRGGTGLGLASVYGIVKQHHGWINVYSEQSKGATFKIYLPAAPNDNVSPSPLKEKMELPRGSETILLVDDEHMIQVLGNAILTRLGYTVLLACDGKEGVDVFMANREKISLTIMDISMPHLSGIEALSQIRSVVPDAKVILSSGYPDTAINYSDPVRGKPSAFVNKPYRPADLAHAIRQVLDGKTPLTR